MQDMTPQACADGTTSTSSTGDTYQKQLIDIRDGKKYWVAKLNDGLCWMTQNLDLDLTDITLSPSDSDMSTTWKPELDSEIWNEKSSNTIKYYDPGDWYCPNGTCSSNPSANNLTSSNNGHDAQGNYYSWEAAVAKSGNNIITDNQNAPDSICPKGWKLPLSGSNNSLNTTAASGSLGKMINSQLGITSTSTADTDLLKSPLYFVRGGRVSNGSLDNAGSNGYYWSSTSSSATNAYTLYFHSSAVSPSSSHYRYLGYSVRCVAR